MLQAIQGTTCRSVRDNPRPQMRAGIDATTASNRLAQSNHPTSTALFVAALHFHGVFHAATRDWTCAARQLLGDPNRAGMAQDTAATISPVGIGIRIDFPRVLANAAPGTGHSGGESGWLHRLSGRYSGFTSAAAFGFLSATHPPIGIAVRPVLSIQNAAEIVHLRSFIGRG